MMAACTSDYCDCNGVAAPLDYAVSDEVTQYCVFKKAPAAKSCPTTPPTVFVIIDDIATVTATD
jgi:hypothetical protein